MILHGTIIDSNNGQAKNVATLNFIVGDSRKLRWKRHILTLSEKRIYKWVTGNSLKSVVTLINSQLFK